MFISNNPMEMVIGQNNHQNRILHISKCKSKKLTLWTSMIQYTINSIAMSLTKYMIINIQYKEL